MSEQKVLGETDSPKKLFDSKAGNKKSSFVINWISAEYFLGDPKT